MTTVANFKNKIDLPEWRPLSVTPVTTAIAHSFACDLRNSIDANPYLWGFQALTSLTKYNTCNDEWLQTAAFTTIGGAIAAGAAAIFVPSHGPSGTVGASPSTTSITLAALPNASSVGLNQLANRGDGTGFKIRIKDNVAGASGKTEETYIIGNTASTTPVVTFSPALTFTPNAAATYEILSGRIYLLGSGSTAAGFWKAFDVATETISGNLNVTNLAATIGTDIAYVVLDELYVPSTQAPGAGFVTGSSTYSNGGIACIVATASGATSITGSGMPAGLLTNEYTNFQVRIVEDGTTPASVGQRRKISSHTSGAAGVFTVAAWATTPSATAKFVVENNNDLMLWTNAASVTYSYAGGGYAADANWSTAAASGGATQYANPGSAMGAGCMASQCFGITPDSAKNARHSHIVRFRGAATTTLDQFDIANGANGTWTSTQTYGAPQTSTFTTASSAVYDPSSNSGRWLYISVNGTQRFCRFDLLNRVMEPWAYGTFTQSTAILGAKMGVSTFIDGSTKVSTLYTVLNTGTSLYGCILQR